MHDVSVHGNVVEHMQTHLLDPAYAMECVMVPHAAWSRVYVLCKRIFSPCPVVKT